MNWTRAGAAGAALALGAAGVWGMMASFAPPFTSSPPPFAVPDPLSLGELDAGMLSADVLVCRGAVSTGTLAVDGGATVVGQFFAGNIQALDDGNVTASLGVISGFQIRSLAGVEDGQSLVSQGTADIYGPLMQGPGGFVTGYPSVRVDAPTVSAWRDTSEPLNLVLTGYDGGSVDAPNAGGIRTPRLTAMDGGYLEISGSGGYASAILYGPTPLLSAPACTTELAGLQIAVLWPLADGGFEARPQNCDGQHWLADDYVLNIIAPVRNGSGVFYYTDPPVPARIRGIDAWIVTSGLGGGSFEFIVRQGSTPLCRGGGLCTQAAGTKIPMACSWQLTTNSPDGGADFALTAQVDAGCTNTPSAQAGVVIDTFGYPDALWIP